MRYITIVFVLLISASTFGQDKNAKASIFVDGVCNMCKARIEKGALKTKGVKSAEWNIKTKKLNVVFNEEKTSAEEISNKIASVGHDTRTVKATEEAYNKVHPCCKYRDEKVRDNHK